jgi:hypothetical protein
MAKLRRVNGLLSDKNLTEKIDRAKDTAKQAKWNYWFDGFPVPENMTDFLTSLKAQMPRISLYPSAFDRINHSYNNSDGSSGGGTIYIVDEFSILMDGYPFDLGRVGYKDYSAKGGDISYGVYSRKIRNPKFAEHRDQYNMVMSLDVKKAVKNASKYIVPYTNTELAKAYYSDIQNNVQSVHDKAQGKLHQLSRDISNDRSAILAEVLHLKKMGVVFKTDVFRQVADVIEEYMSDASSEQRRNVTCVFVRFRKVGDEMYADIQEAVDVRENKTKLMYTNPSVTYPMSELPENIMSSISVLNILNDGQYVDKVGMKIDDLTFWIERN